MGSCRLPKSSMLGVDQLNNWRTLPGTAKMVIRAGGGVKSLREGRCFSVKLMDILPLQNT